MLDKIDMVNAACGVRVLDDGGHPKPPMTYEAVRTLLYGRLDRGLVGEEFWHDACEALTEAEETACTAHAGWPRADAFEGADGTEAEILTCPGCGVDYIEPGSVKPPAKTVREVTSRQRLYAQHVRHEGWRPVPPGVDITEGDVYCPWCRDWFVRPAPTPEDAAVAWVYSGRGGGGRRDTFEEAMEAARGMEDAKVYGVDAAGERCTLTFMPV